MRQLAEEGAGNVWPMPSTVTSNPEIAGVDSEAGLSTLGRAESVSHTIRILDMRFLKTTAEGAVVLP